MFKGELGTFGFYVPFGLSIMQGLNWLQTLYHHLFILRIVFHAGRSHKKLIIQLPKSQVKGRNALTKRCCSKEDAEADDDCFILLTPE